MADQRLIPAGIRDASTLALNDLIDRMGTVDITPLLVYLIDSVEETALPHLAEQFSVTGYDGWALAQGDTDRRELIKRAIELHRRKGTPWAVRTALETAGFNATLIEWFMQTPAGAPHTCRVEVEIDDRGMARSSFGLVESLVDEYKPVRVHTTTQFQASTRGSLYVAASQAIGGAIITPACPMNFQQPGRINITTACVVGITATTQPYATQEV
ncbi:MAG: phage tail protein I [Geobacter sp.]|nr:phage tail protein I [Geobacter sp.]